MILISAQSVLGVELALIRFGVVVQGQSAIQTFKEDAGNVIGEIPFNASAEAPFIVTPVSGTTRGRDEAFALSVSSSAPPGTYVNRKVRVNFHQRTGDDVKETIASVAVVPNPVLSAVVLVAGGAKKVSATALDFGTVVVGNRASRTIQIRNNSASQVLIRATITSSNAILFGMNSSPTATLAPGASQAIDIDFPVQFNLGQQKATLNVSSEVVGLPQGNVPVPAPAGQLVLPLKGTVLSNVNIPAVLDFGTVSVNSSQQKLLDVVNLASASVVILVPPTAGPFKLAPTFVPLSSPGARAAIVVTLPAQQSAGSIAVTLSVQVGDGDQGDLPEVKTVTIKANVVP